MSGRSRRRRGKGGCRHFYSQWYTDDPTQDLWRRNCGRCGWNQRWRISERGKLPTLKSDPRRASAPTTSHATPCPEPDCTKYLGFDGHCPEHPPGRTAA